MFYATTSDSGCKRYLHNHPLADMNRENQSSFAKECSRDEHSKRVCSRELPVN